MRHLVSAMLVVVAIIHLLPLSGALGPEQLQSLYGLNIADPNLSVLMRHRAILFGLLGAFLLLAAFRPELQTLAFIGGFVSVVSFLLLMGSTGGNNSQLSRVFTVDIVALTCLIVGSTARFYGLRGA